MISVSQLTKLYGNFPAVSGLTFDVGPGEVLGLVGPNGAGKTTTLRCLVGIIAPSQGSVTIDGHDLAKEPVEAKRSLAFIPDEPYLFEYLTVAEHLEFVARVYGATDAAVRGPELLRELELVDKANVLPGELSRGMRQKLAIACGLLHAPSGLILDEPLTGLDPGGMRRMKNTIAARAREGASVVLSSHLLHLVEELCTKLLVIAKGRMVAYGTLAQIVAERPGLAGRSLEEVFLLLTGDADGHSAEG